MATYFQNMPPCRESACYPRKPTRIIPTPVINFGYFDIWSAIFFVSMQLFLIRLTFTLADVVAKLGDQRDRVWSHLGSKLLGVLLREFVGWAN